MPIMQGSAATSSPTGTIAGMATTAAPSGWLLCNGGAVSRSTYAALFAAIGTLYGVGDGATTFNVPELRGEFLRGADQGRGIDAGRAVGTAQAGQMPAHTHTYEAELEPTSMYISTEPGYKGRNTGNTGSTGGTDNASENRPRNVSVLYCIKA